MRLKTLTLLSAVAISLARAPAWAELGFVLTPATQSTVAGNRVIFNGTLTNQSLTGNLFLNGIRVAFTGATNILADTNVFFANVPGILLPGETYSDLIFAVAINANAAPGSYFGTVAIGGGTNIFAAADLASQPFEVSLPSPALAIARSGTGILLSWPAPADGFVLQRNLDLIATNWIALTNTPLLTNAQFQVILSPPDGTIFYRLQRP